MTKENLKGLKALSPLIVFLGIYLVSSLVADDFYKVPVSVAFLIASVYAFMIGGGKSIEEKTYTFSKGAGNRNVLLMIWIFILAGAFASCAKAIGSVEATVNLTLTIVPGKLILVGLFLAACFISMAIGTSVGTIVALMPIAAGIADQSSLSLPMVSALIVGGAFFGDNLSFISDTTIVATSSQGCSMSDKFKANIWIAGPAAVVIAVVYMFMGMKIDARPVIGHIDFIRLIPYLAVIILAFMGISVLGVLTIGLLLCGIIGFSSGMGWVEFLQSAGKGISDMGDLIIVTLLAGGMLEVISYEGGIQYIVHLLTKKIRGKRGAYFSIAGMVGLADLCTANNTIAILTTGEIAKNISSKYGLDSRKTASILDTFSCIVQCIIPYGAQVMMAAGIAKIPSISIIRYLYYPAVLLVVACASIIFRFPAKYESR